MFLRLKNVRNRSYELTSCCFVVKKQQKSGVDAAHLLVSSFFVFNYGRRKSEFILIKLMHLKIQIMKIIHFKPYP